MELTQITYFLTLARMLHFTRAAEACNVSQPALTKAIQRLEDELGGPLFLRERSRTQLTELGRLVLPQLEQAQAAIRDARVQADAFRRRECSPLRVGLELSLPAALLSPVLSAVSRRMADFELRLEQYAQGELCERMLDGALDLALLIDRGDLPERLHRWTMFAERHVLICPPGHRLATCAEIGIADLAGERLLLHQDSDCPIRRFLDAAFTQLGLKPGRQAFASSQEQILDMVRASFGVCVAGERLSELAHLPSRPIAADPASRSVTLTTVAGRQLGPTPALFLKLLRARAWTSGTDRYTAAAA